MNEGDPKDFQRSDRSEALQRNRDEIKRLEGSLRRQQSKIENLERENERLKEENERLKDELKALRGVPDWVRPNKSEEAKREPQKLGPKRGHEAHPRRVPARIDREVTIVPKECPGCHNQDLPRPSRWHSHIQIDLPPVSRPIVTKYNVGWCYCRVCRREISSREKLSYSQYGPILHAQVSYWKYHLGLTFGKIQSLLKDQYALEISTGELSELVGRSAKVFNGMYEDLRLSLLEEDSLNVDETGWRNSGDNAWLWSFSGEGVSYYDILRSRGQKVIERTLGESYEGVLGSDFCPAYNKIDSKKQRCWTHLLRWFRELKEKYPQKQKIRYFENRMKRFFRWGLKLQDLYEKGENIDRAYQRLLASTLKCLVLGLQDVHLRRPCKTLLAYRGELYTFIKTGTDPTNNRAEREIRPAVLMRKTSYGNRSDEGAKTQAILMSVIRTCAKQGLNFVELAADRLKNYSKKGE